MAKAKSYEIQVDDKGQKIECLECGRWYHKLYLHLKSAHGMTIEEYQDKHGDSSPIMSEFVEKLLAKPRKKKGSDLLDNYKTEEKKEEKEEETVEETVEEGVLRIGVARLKVRDDLTDYDKGHLQDNDPNWIFGRSQMEQWEDIAIGIEDNEPIYIGGPTGCGKSASVQMLAAALNQPLRRVQLNRDFKAADFIGRATLEVDEKGTQVTGWKDGVATEAVRYGHWLLLDEVDQAHPDVMMALQALLEGAPLVLSGNFGEVVQRHPNFRIIATANTFGRGDETGLYAGAKVQNEATLDRYGVVINADYPDRDVEADILVKKTEIKRDIARRMVSVAHKVRKALIEEECACTFSTRRLIGWSKKTVRYNGDIRRASKVAVLNKMEPEDGRFVDSLIQRYFGGELQ